MLQWRTKRTQPAGTGTSGESTTPESQTCVLSVVAFMNVHVLKLWLIFLFKHWFKNVGSGRDAVLEQVLLQTLQLQGLIQRCSWKSSWLLRDQRANY